MILPRLFTYQLSFSYARDFNLPSWERRCTAKESVDPAIGPNAGFAEATTAAAAGEAMKTNVDGVYATRRVSCGGIVLTEDELPDCALPR